MTQRSKPPSHDPAPEECVPLEPDLLDRSEDDVDETLMETFPASDPPSWAGLGRVGSPKRIGNDCPVSSAPLDENDSS
jgi:hypothetical protein